MSRMGTMQPLVGAFLCLLVASAAPVEGALPAPEGTLYTYRLVFKMPADRHDDFAAIFDDTLLPLAVEHGLKPSVLPQRSVSDSAFCRLFDVTSPLDADRIFTAMAADSAWQAAVVSARARVNFTAGLPWTTLPFRIWLGEGISHPLRGAGTRQGQWQSYGHQDGLPFPSLTTLWQDRQGDLWFGTYHGGICRFDGAQFYTLHTPGLDPFFVTIQRRGPPVGYGTVQTSA